MPRVVRLYVLWQTYSHFYKLPDLMIKVDSLKDFNIGTQSY